MHIPDRKAAQEYRNELRRSLDLFRVNLQESVARVIKQQEELLKEMKSQRSQDGGYGNDQRDGVDIIRTGSSIFPQIPLSYGQNECTPASNGANYLYAPRDVTSINSGNTTTTIIKNSNNCS